MESIWGGTMIDFSKIKELSIGGIKLKELYIDDVQIWKSGLLPTGYTQLEYIEATGTQYIDSGITGHTGISVEANYMVTGLNGNAATDGIIIGSSNSANQRMYIAVNGTADPFAWELGASNYKVKSFSSKFNYKYNIKVNWTTQESALYIDGVATDISLAATNFDNSTNMYILARNKGGAQYFCHGRLYDMKIWDNGALVRNYIPAINENGVVGMYDSVGKNFYTSAGTGSFTPGPVTNIGLLSSDNYILRDINGLYLTAKRRVNNYGD